MKFLLKEKIVKGNFEHENLNPPNYDQGILKSRLSKLSNILNGYLAVSVLIFIPIFCDNSETLCGNAMLAPFEFFFNFCFPLGLAAFLMGTKLAINLNEWWKFFFNLGKFTLPIPFVIQYFRVLQMMNLEVSPYSIWWLGFLK